MRLKIEQTGVYAPVSEIMSSCLKCLFVADSVQKAVTMFQANRINHLPVTSNKKIVGMLSSTDVKHCVKQHSMDKTVEEFMTHEVVCVQHNTSIYDTAVLFVKHPFHAMPVLSNDDVVGIVTTTDIVKYFLNQDKN